MPDVRFKIIDDRIGSSIKVPEYSTEGSAGMDLRACVDEVMVIEPAACELIPTGIAIYIEDPHITALLLPRSGLGHKHGIVLGNLVGVIDSDYQGQVYVSCWNRSAEPFAVRPGDRIAQMVFVPVIRPTLVQVEKISPSQRASGGFGHTGID